MRARFVALWVAALTLVGSFVYGVTTSPAKTPSQQAAPRAKPTACGHGKNTCTPTPTTTVPTTPSSSTSTTPPPPAHKVMVIIEENHSQTEAITLMPHLASWANTYGKATAYTAVTHPSLPNYLAIAGGSTFGVADDNAPSSHPISGDSVFDQTITAGLHAKTYAEGMTSNCMLSNTGRYAVKHNPWAYFNGATQRANCNANDVPLGTTSTGNLRNDIDAGTLPNTGMMIPDLCNDAHDCSLLTADNWLNGWVPQLMSGPDYTSGNLTIVITFDEDDSSAGNNVAFVVIDPRLSGKVVASAATHYSLTRWLDANVGAPLLRSGATAPDLKSAFGI